MDVGPGDCKLWGIRKSKGFSMLKSAKKTKPSEIKAGGQKLGVCRTNQGNTPASKTRAKIHMEGELLNLLGGKGLPGRGKKGGCASGVRGVSHITLLARAHPLT